MTFPRRRSDGSFELLVRIDSVAVETLHGWLKNWVDKNSTWRRDWEGASAEVLEYFEDFSKVPMAESVESGVVIRLCVRPRAKWWKDWYARLTDDVIKDHPGAAFVGVTSDP